MPKFEGMSNTEQGMSNVEGLHQHGWRMENVAHGGLREEGF